MIEGPGPPATWRFTTWPTTVEPIMRRAVISSGDPLVETCDTQRILLVWVFGGGASNGYAKRSAAMPPSLESS